MENKSLINESLETLLSSLEKFIKTETVVGQPIAVGETTIIPIVTVTFGYGGGGGAGKDEKGVDNNGASVGAGAKITPDAVLVIKGDEVTMLSVKNRCNLDKLVAMVPDIIKKFKIKKETEA